MIQSELLKEKNRIQNKLSMASTSVHDYLKSSRQDAKDIAQKHGFSLQYVEVPGKPFKIKKPQEL